MVVETLAHPVVLLNIGDTLEPLLSTTTISPPLGASGAKQRYGGPPVRASKDNGLLGMGFR